MLSNSSVKPVAARIIFPGPANLLSEPTNPEDLITVTLVPGKIKISLDSTELK